MSTKESLTRRGQGIYVDPVAVWIRKTLLNPWLMGGVSAFLHLGFKIANIRAFLDYGQTQHLAKGTAALSAVGLLIRLNDYLTTQYHNNWTRDDSWNWNDEIVLITGGSSGIGANVA